MQYMREELFLFKKHSLIGGDLMTKKKFIKWLKDALIRAVKSFAQTMLASIGTEFVVLSEFHLGFVLMSAGMAAIISLLMSLERLPEEDVSENNKTEGKS